MAKIMSDWSKGFVEWVENDMVFLSVPFTWELEKAHTRAEELRKQGYRVRAGGPAVDLMPHIMEDVAELGGAVNALVHHNPNATFTSRGCVRKCPFCAVWRVEGTLRELEDWPVKPIVCDNNLLACSKKHFDDVIDKLKPLKEVDFNQGLDARLLTKYHVERLAELDCLVRLAWDDVDLGNAFMAAYEKLRKARIPKNRIRCYVLFGFADTPKDAWFRLRTLKNIGIMPNPMRYQPLNTLKKNSYVGKHWTGKMLTAFMRYWARLRFTAAIPFDEWLSHEYDMELEE